MSDSPPKTLVIAPGRVTPDYLAGRRDASGNLTPPGTTGEIERNRLSVLTVLFIVTGAFGLPLLWRSDRFSTLGKWGWSVLVIVYTAALFYGMVMIVLWSVGDVLR